MAEAEQIGNEINIDFPSPLPFQVKDAGDMDHLIAAHEEFLETIIKRSLLDDKSANILAQLRLLLDQIIKFQNIQVSEDDGEETCL